MWLLGLRQETTGSKNRRARTTFRPDIQGEPKISVSPKSERTRLASRGWQVGEGATRGHQLREVALLRDAASPMHPRPNSSCRGKGGAANAAHGELCRREQKKEKLWALVCGAPETRRSWERGRTQGTSPSEIATPRRGVNWVWPGQKPPPPQGHSTHTRQLSTTRPRHHRLWPRGALPPALPRWLPFVSPSLHTSRVFRKFFDGRTD